MTGENKQQNSGLLGWFLFVVGFAGALFVGWVIFPQLLFSTKYQPINYNHAIHQEEADMTCEDCHDFREDGSYAGKPKLEQCIECHEEPVGETEAEEFFISEYVEPGKEVPWISYTKQPDNVFFSHAAHVQLAEMECTECHRDVEKETIAPPVRVNRLTAYPNELMKMYVCEDCHARQNVPNGCAVCHK
ncbi:MAG: menaquinone reductase multiheme cytochrome c subunit QrcA [Candidatus Binatia bacterium]